MEVYLQNKGQLLISLLMQNSCPVGWFEPPFHEVSTSHTHTHTHTQLSNFQLCQWDVIGDVCKRFTTPNPALNLLTTFYTSWLAEKEKNMLGEGWASGLLMRSEILQSQGRKVQPNELKFLRNLGFSTTSMEILCSPAFIILSQTAQVVCNNMKIPLSL